MFILTAASCFPALAALWAIRPGPHRRAQTTSHPLDFPGLKSLLVDHRLLVFAICVLLFHLSNAAMLPLAGAAVTMRAGNLANFIIAACIVVPTGVVALMSPWVGRAAEKFGRKRLLLGWGALPLRGLLLAVLPGSWLLVAGQAVSGVSAAAFGVLLPLLAADLTLGTSHFNLCMGVPRPRGLSRRRGQRDDVRRNRRPRRHGGRFPRPRSHWSARLRGCLAGHAGDTTNPDPTQSASSGMTQSGLSPRITRSQLSNALRKRVY